MASGKKESEAFNMLKFMYQDDDDDMEDADGGGEEPELQVHQLRSDGEAFKVENSEQLKSMESDADIRGNSVQQLDSRRSNLRSPAEGVAVESQRSRRGPAIIDYGHDDLAMSPEAEEGDILSNVQVMHGEDANNAYVGNAQMTISSISLTSPPSVRIENLEYDATDDASKEFDMEDSTGVNSLENLNPLNNFLPPPPKGKCSEELQEKINKFLAYKRIGKSFNAEVGNRKDYRNPDFLLHAVSYQGIDQIGSCFSKDVFDPHGYDESDYADAIGRSTTISFFFYPYVLHEIYGYMRMRACTNNISFASYLFSSTEADRKLEMERREQEKKKNPKVEFVSGGTQQAALLAAAKISMSASGVPNLPSGGSQSVSAHAMAREGRQNKKSKWDKVDDDPMTATVGGQATHTAAQATMPHTANVGSGYSTFTQQKRREAEERRSSERKVDRRS